MKPCLRARHPSYGRASVVWAPAACPFKMARSQLSSPRTSRVNCFSSTATTISYFEVLGVAESASLDEIKAAFRSKSKVLHPDVNKEPTASRDFMLLRRAYTTLTTSELRAEYEAKMGMPSARARDPRFARFERWRREVIPDLRIQLDFWTRGIEGYVEAWRASVDRREQNLARLYDACLAAVRQLQRAAVEERNAVPASNPFSDHHHHHHHHESAAHHGSNPHTHHHHQQQQQQQQQDPVSAVSSPDELEQQRREQERQHLVLECEEGLREMAAEVEGIAADGGDGPARVEREVEKRYQQLTGRYPAYPDIVWIDVWEETADQWLALSAAEAQRCTAAASLWSGRVQQLRGELRGVQEAAMAAGVEGQVAGAGTGRFHQG